MTFYITWLVIIVCIFYADTDNKKKDNSKQVTTRVKVRIWRRIDQNILICRTTYISIENA